jgi:transposase
VGGTGRRWAPVRYQPLTMEPPVRDVDLFQLALGLETPWRVERSEFDAEGKRLDLYIDFHPGGTFACPECGGRGCKAHDTSDKTWRHLNFFQHETYLHVRTPRVRCERCGVKLVEVPWARHGSGFTLLFEAFLLALCKAMPVAAVARLVNEHDTRIWRVLHHYVDKARFEADFSEVRRVGVDETSSKRGHNYVSLFVDLEEARVLFATPGREAATFAVFRQDLVEHGGDPEQIRELCMDLSPAYLKGAREVFPQAEVTLDRFHISKLLNEAMDQVRRQEQKEHPELKRTRYLWLRNPQDLRRMDAERLAELLPEEVGLRTAEAYRIKLAFQEFWRGPFVAARSYLHRWCRMASESGLEPMIRVARTLYQHQEGLLNWFRSQISNGLLEGISSLVQAAKAKARGYRSLRNLIAMVYLLTGKLEFDVPSI